jgi:hypothetical protein
MSLKEKHKPLIGNTPTARIHKVQSMLSFIFLFVVFLLLLSPVFASPQQKTLNTGSSKIVYSAADSSMHITKGKITAIRRQSISLLPGTHLKAQKDESLVINIADKSQQEALAREETRRREERMLAQIILKQENNLIPKIDTSINSYCTKGAPPVSGSSISLQNTQLAAVSTTSTASAKTPVSAIKNKTNIQNIHTHLVSMVKTFSPSRSWGDAAETIKVLRC